jgi:predicted ATPase
LTEPLLFSEKLLKGRLEQYLDADNISSETVFFDRGLPDIFAYMNYIGLDYPDKFIRVSKENRYDFVFLMPPWEDIYITDNERYENFEQALAIHNHLMRAYENLEYSVVEVPTGEVEKRADFILKVIKTFS